jgi:hypothetical protein
MVLPAAANIAGVGGRFKLRFTKSAARAIANVARCPPNKIAATATPAAGQMVGVYPLSA